MAGWKNISVNIQNIQAETAKAVLFNCPHKSRYDGFSFWHPAKLVREGKHSYAVSVSYTDDFEFTLRRYSKHKEVIAEVKIDAKEFEKIFGVMDGSISAPKKKDEYETHVPKEITEMPEASVDDSLRR